MLTAERERARKKSSTSYCRFCCFLFPHLLFPCSKGRGTFSLNCQKRRMKEAMFTSTKQAAGTGIGKTEACGCSSAPSLTPAKAVLTMPPSLEPWEEGLDLLVFFPVREVMLSRRAVVGDFCWGGVRHCFPSSSSDVEDTSSPIRIRSKLPSSTPFPNHRPQGNLPKGQQKHGSVTWVGSFISKPEGQ